MQHYIEWLKNELKIDDLGMSRIELEETSDEEWGVDDAEAYVAVEDFGLFKTFEIEYKASLKDDQEAFMLMLAHELVHVMQELRGDVFDYSKPYSEQSHEIEAYEMQEVLYAKYLQEEGEQRRSSQG